MTRLWIVAMLLALATVPLKAQQPVKVARIAMAFNVTPETAKNRIDAFLQSMRELGYRDGKNLRVEYRYAEGDPSRSRVPDLKRLGVVRSGSNLKSSGRTLSDAQESKQLEIASGPTGDYFTDHACARSKRLPAGIRFAISRESKRHSHY